MGNKKDVRRKWQTKKDDAKKRGIPCSLTLEEYKKLMQDAGITLDQIGSKKGQFGLARFGDIGGYSLNNCRFITTSENQREASKTKPKNGLPLGGGSYESVKGCNHYKDRGLIVTPWGIFDTIRLAALAPGCTCSAATIHRRIKNNIPGFFYSSY